MAVTIAALVDAVETTLGAAVGIETSMSFDELTEGIPAMDCPRLQVHPAGGDCNPPGRTDRITFGAGMQMTNLEVFADLYARERSQLDEDMEVTVELIDALITVLQAQEKPPFFGLSTIKAFTWNWRRSTFDYGGSRYMGARFRIFLKIF